MTVLRRGRGLAGPPAPASWCAFDSEASRRWMVASACGFGRTLAVRQSAGGAHCQRRERMTKQTKE